MADADRALQKLLKKLLDTSPSQLPAALVRARKAWVRAGKPGLPRRAPKHVRPELLWCKRFRQLQKMCMSLEKPLLGGLDEQPDREDAIKHAMVLLQGMAPYGSQAEHIVNAVRFLYEGRDDEAARVFKDLADEELDALREPEDEAEEAA